MAIFSAQLKTFSRSAGRSAVAASAYRAGEKIDEQETGQVHDYTRKGGVLHSAILAPANVDTPEWVHDRSALWNHAHEVNGRKNAVLARELTIALPHELNEQERTDLAVGFAQWVADRQQVMCDVVVHEPSREGDDRNHHMHLMMTSNIVNEDGLQKAKSHVVDGKRTRCIVFDEGGTLGSEELKTFRSEICEQMNEALEQGGYEVRVDERSYVEQELDRIPTIHLGKHATELERQGVETDLGNYNREVSEWNQIQDVFNHHDITFTPASNDYSYWQDIEKRETEPRTSVLEFSSESIDQALPEPSTPHTETIGLWQQVQEHFSAVSKWLRECTENAVQQWQSWLYHEESQQPEPDTLAMEPLGYAERVLLEREDKDQEPQDPDRLEQGFSP